MSTNKILDSIGERVLTEKEYNDFLDAELMIKTTLLRWDYNDPINEPLRRKTLERIE